MRTLQLSRSTGVQVNDLNRELDSMMNWAKHKEEPEQAKMPNPW